MAAHEILTQEMKKKGVVLLEGKALFLKYWDLALKVRSGYLCLELFLNQRLEEGFPWNGGAMLEAMEWLWAVKNEYNCVVFDISRVDGVQELKLSGAIMVSRIYQAHGMPLNNKDSFWVMNNKQRANVINSHLVCPSGMNSKEFSRPKIRCFAGETCDSLSVITQRVINWRRTRYNLPVEDPARDPEAMLNLVSGGAEKEQRKQPEEYEDLGTPLGKRFNPKPKGECA